jgi:hypothetical protein
LLSAVFVDKDRRGEGLSAIVERDQGWGRMALGVALDHRGLSRIERAIHEGAGRPTDMPSTFVLEDELSRGEIETLFEGARWVQDWI